MEGGSEHTERQASLRADAAARRSGVDDEHVEEQLFSFDWPTGWPVVEDNWVHEPFAHVALVRNPATGEVRYHVTELSMDELASFVREDVTERLRTRLLDVADDAGWTELCLRRELPHRCRVLAEMLENASTGTCAGATTWSARWTGSPTGWPCRRFGGSPPCWRRVSARPTTSRQCSG